METNAQNLSVEMTPIALLQCRLSGLAEDDVRAATREYWSSSNPARAGRAMWRSTGGLVIVVQTDPDASHVRVLNVWRQ